MGICGELTQVLGDVPVLSVVAASQLVAPHSGTFVDAAKMATFYDVEEAEVGGPKPLRAPTEARQWDSSAETPHPKELAQDIGILAAVSTAKPQFGRTEVIDNTLNPDFVRKFIVDYFFEEKQNLRFDL
ncbi:hypothetical protein P7K49_007892 [Saguinus oedipus]|uniref:C2 domain-containing protein n=1 Tax=Saguinus oedipus TaxID=9490 RepID=A0ABQ9VW63_SAGOE|nr:hypothetical protein P7K49_007892 [Saguinus oedipus]